MLDINEARKMYQLHNDSIIKLVPAKSLLVYDVKDGWEPLCNFLEVEKPDINFSHTNRRVEFDKKAKYLLW